MSGLTLSEAAEVLGVDKSAVSKVRSGTYDRPNSTLPARYEALVRLIERAGASGLGHVPDADIASEMCRRCPRDDCTGCRVLEM